MCATYKICYTSYTVFCVLCLRLVDIYKNRHIRDIGKCGISTNACCLIVDFSKQNIERMCRVHIFRLKIARKCFFMLNWLNRSLSLCFSVVLYTVRNYAIVYMDGTSERCTTPSNVSCSWVVWLLFVHWWKWTPIQIISFFFTLSCRLLNWLIHDDMRYEIYII